MNEPGPFFPFIIPKDPGTVCPKKGIISTIPLRRWDLDHQSYSRKGSGFIGCSFIRFPYERSYELGMARRIET